VTTARSRPELRLTIASDVDLAAAIDAFLSQRGCAHALPADRGALGGARHAQRAWLWCADGRKVSPGVIGIACHFFGS